MERAPYKPSLEWTADKLQQIEAEGYRKGRTAALKAAAQAIKALPDQPQDEGDTSYSEYNEALDVAEHAVRRLAEEGGATADPPAKSGGAAD